MTAIEFAPYSSFHIRFKLNDGRELSGSILLPSSSEKKKAGNFYDFVPTKNMIEWQLAEKKGNTEKMESLLQQVDIENIVWADRLKY